MGAAQSALWKNLARRRGLLEEYEARPFEVKYFGVHFRLVEQPTDEDRLLLYNMAAAIRERINGRPFINILEFLEKNGRLPNLGIFRRSGAVLINGHLAAQVIRGLMRLAEEGVIPPIKFGERRPDPYDAERWRRIIGGEGCIKIDLLWTKVPEGSYPGAKIVFSGRERIAVWRIACDDRCVLIIFRNWANPVHASRIMMDAAALASLAQRHSPYYPWTRALIISTKTELRSPVIEAFKFRSNAVAGYNPYLAPPTLRKAQPSCEEELWFPLILPREVDVKLYPVADYTQPKEAYKWIERKLPINLSEAYGGSEELSEYSLELALNAILQALGIRMKIIEKVRDTALKLGGAELLRRTMTECILEGRKFRKGEPAEATAIKALLRALQQLERMQKDRERELKKAQKTKTKNKQAAHNILMYNFGGNDERGEDWASRDAALSGEYFVSHGSSTFSASTTHMRAATWRFFHICNFFFIGFLRGEGWVQPGPFEAKVRVYKKAVSRGFKPYKRIMHYQYIMFTDPLGGRYWFPVSCLTSASRALFARSLNRIVDDYWRILELDDKFVEFSRLMLKAMALVEMMRAAWRIRARKYRMLVRSFVGLALFHLNTLIGEILSRLAKVGIPDEPWVRRLFIMRLIDWVEAGENRDLRDLLYMYRYRGFIEDDVHELLREEERRGELFPGAPIIDPELPPDNYREYKLHERWIFWMNYVKKASEKWDNPDLDTPIPDDVCTLR